MKDINVYEVAIRYSSKLTKDMVFAGLKDIFQAIGEAAQSQGAVKLEFGDIGSLCIKDCKAFFVFESEFAPFEEDSEAMVQMQMLQEEHHHLHSAPSNEAAVKNMKNTAPLEVATANAPPRKGTHLVDVPTNQVREKEREKEREKHASAMGKINKTKNPVPNRPHTAGELKRPQTAGENCHAKKTREEQTPWPALKGMKQITEPFEDEAHAKGFEHEEYIRRLHAEYVAEGGPPLDFAVPDSLLTCLTRRSTATASTHVTYLSNNDCLSPGAKKRMKRWVRHEEILKKNKWDRVPIDRFAPIKTPAPRAREESKMAPQMGRLVLDAGTGHARPKTAVKARSEYL